MDLMKKVLRTLGLAHWTHRMIYAGLAGAYGAGCLGLDKDIVMQITAALYCAMFVKG